MKIRNNCDIWTCAWQNRTGLCSQLSLIRLVWRSFVSLFDIAKSLIRLGGWPHYGFVLFVDDVWTRMGPYSSLLKDEHIQLSEMGFRRFWARREFVRSPKGAHTCGFYKHCICPILICKTGRRLFRSPYGVCTGPHCIRRVTFRNPWDTRTGCTDNWKNAYDNCIAGGWLRTDLGSWMTTCLGKGCPFGLPRVPFVNCCQFMYLVTSLLVLRAGCGI